MAGQVNAKRTSFNSPFHCIEWNFAFSIQFLVLLVVGLSCLLHFNAIYCSQVCAAPHPGSEERGKIVRGDATVIMLKDYVPAGRVFYRRTLFSSKELSPKARVQSLQEELRMLKLEIDKLQSEQNGLIDRVKQKQHSLSIDEQKVALEIKDASEKAGRLNHLKLGSANETRSKYTSLATKKYGLQVQAHKLASDQMKLMSERKQLESLIKQASMERYISTRSKDLSPAIRGALLSSTEAMIPFFDTLSMAVDANERLLDHVSDEIAKYVHFNVRQSPFIAGVLFYFMTLIPMIALTRLALVLARSSKGFTISHYIFFGNLYLTILAAMCGLSVIVFDYDATRSLVTGRNKPKFLLMALGLVALFLWQFMLLLVQTIAAPIKANAAQLLGTLAVVFHFCMFVLQPALLRTSPFVLPSSYFVYATIFSCICAERAVRLNYKNPLSIVSEKGGWRRLKVGALNLLDSISRSLGPLLISSRPKPSKMKYSTKEDRKIVSRENQSFLSRFLGSNKNEKESYDSGSSDEESSSSSSANSSETYSEDEEKFRKNRRRR